MQDFKILLSKSFWQDTIKNPKLLIEISFIRYLIIGFSAFFLDYGTLKLLSIGFNIDAVYANLVSTFLGLSFAFTFSNYWTFKAGGKNKFKKLTKFGLLSIFNYFVQVIIFAILVRPFGFNEDLSKVGVTGLIVCWNFFVYKFWIFK